MIRLPNDFKDFLKLCDRHAVEYVIVGGYAVGFHGHPRATGDLDVFAARTPENAQRLVEVFREFGFDSPEITAELFLEPKAIVRIGVPPLRLEVFNTISGVTFDECLPFAIEIVYDGTPVRFIGLDQLLENKRAAGRFKDLADVEALTQTNTPQSRPSDPQ